MIIFWCVSARRAAEEELTHSAKAGPMALRSLFQASLRMLSYLGHHGQVVSKVLIRVAVEVVVRSGTRKGNPNLSMLVRTSRGTQLPGPPTILRRHLRSASRAALLGGEELGDVRKAGQGERPVEREVRAEASTLVG